MNMIADGKNSQIRVDLTPQIEYIYARIEPETIRAIAKLDDEAIKLSVMVLICELTKGVKQMPTKAHKTRLAKELIKRGVKCKKIEKLLNISKSTYYRLRGENE
ncbi:resolvase [Campylobacter sp. RM6883]|uniref:resolvase n=2 Tax=Campylobacter californiensis TaxID=1032243 RepID=UPI00145199AF|nr:resolvase [Campylobacter sp. RM6914]MBE2985347.1 resolvase [Campylobacter sp. RM6883]QCD51230.1 hypothetical protein CCAL_1345 [Campylobacter sp. RM6914]